MADQHPLLWTPSPERIARSRLHNYQQWLAERGKHFADYNALWQWSVENIEEFWASVWDYFEITCSVPYKRVLVERTMPGAIWFEDSRLNFAEQLFRFNTAAGSGDKPAVIAESEIRARTSLSWQQLRDQVTAVSNTLRAMGVQPGDRIAAYLPNTPEAVVAFFACASVGAIWSSCSPDMGASSVLDRFQQIEPKVLIAVDGYRYGGKDFDRMNVVSTLRDELKTLQHTVLFPYLDAAAQLDGAMLWDELFSHPAAQATPMIFDQVAADHPLWILYSSGTTGMPKPIVHGHAGSLLEAVKGNALSLDLGEDDRFLWFTTTGWVMWNAQITALLVGSTICIYDGNPGYPDMSRLWRFAEDTQLTFMGVGAAFYANCMKAGIEPSKIADLSRLRGLGSTGSPLADEAFHWIYENVHPDIMLASISGGTDVVATFVGACPVLPIYAGEMQCRSLGIAVHAFNDHGESVIDDVGELVVTQPMPTMPLFFWNDPGNKRYLDSYFDHYPGVWRHGDWIRITPRGGAIIYGRSDATINRYGIRMGTAEIYRVVDELPEVVDSMVVDLEFLGRESYMPLFVVLREGLVLNDAITHKLRENIRTQLSARYLPNDIFLVPEIPRTLTGKKMELPIKKLLLGTPIEKIANPDAMSNPQSLQWYAAFAENRLKALVS